MFVCVAVTISICFVDWCVSPCVCLLVCVGGGVFFALSPTSVVCLMAATTSRRYVFCSALCVHTKWFALSRLNGEKFVMLWKISQWFVVYFVRFRKYVKWFMAKNDSRVQYETIYKQLSTQQQAPLFMSKINFVHRHRARCIRCLANRFANFPCDNDKWTRDCGAKGK